MTQCTVNKLCSYAFWWLHVAKQTRHTLDTATKTLWLLTHDIQPQPTPFVSVLNWASTLGLTGIFRVPPSGVDAKAGASNKIKQSEEIGLSCLTCIFSFKSLTDLDRKHHQKCQQLTCTDSQRLPCQRACMHLEDGRKQTTLGYIG